ncbi:TetR/AcrR family transcriptional regulator [Paraburkholderia elongata]|uniref:TetR family transcriptional regulator n=1 Tax=Paraburkholderia elongata TaxID=2675747 RepID=A0A972NJG8_9BURK|nr:TetR/AcrR family transcriptional regulator [Paraburkholderia elongata]NPT53977.1 TetR family transcriptional regulator [Paraburkholderia elongata]
MVKSSALRASRSASADAAATVAAAPRAAGRPTQDAAAELRERLLNAATQAFRAEGFGGARVEEIAARAGISKTTVYRQYGTKEDLFRAAIWHGMEDLRGRIEQLLKPRRDFSKTLLVLLRTLTDHMASTDTIEITRVSVGESHRFPDVAKGFLQYVNAMLEPVANFIASAAQGGTISVSDAPQAARDLLTLVAGSSEVLMGIPTTPAQRQQRATHIQQLLLSAWGYKAPDHQDTPQT